MPTLVSIDGFEYGLAALSTNGAGIATTNSRSAGISCDASVKNSGGYSLKLVQDGATATRLRKTIATAQRLLVMSMYFRIDAAPGVQSQFFAFNGPSVAPIIRIETDGKMTITMGGGTVPSTPASVCDGAWHLLDLRADCTTGSFTVDWAIDGSAQTQANRTSQTSADFTLLDFGASAAGNNATIYYDDWVLSVTTGDYPIGAHSVLAVAPSADGTHNAGTNTMESNAGTDIPTVPAYSLVNTIPPTTTPYLQQATVGTGNYAEVDFANHDATMTTIWDAQCLLAYWNSASGQPCEGATIVSSDAFSTYTEIFGNPTTRQDYSESSLFYKVSNTATVQGVLTRPGGGWTTTAFDALQARMGYAGDVIGLPRWSLLLIQYAGTLGAEPPAGETEFIGSVPV